MGISPNTTSFRKFLPALYWCAVAGSFVLFSLGNLFAQESSPKPAPQAKMREAIRATSEGREFWLCFQKNSIEPERDARTNRINPKDQIFLELFLTSGEDTKVVIEIDGLLFRQEMRIRGGTVVNVKIDTAAQVRSSEVPERLAVHIVSEKTLSVYGLSHRYQTTDSYMGLPVEALGTEYRTVNYYKLREDLISQFAIIATQDSTSVTITPTSPTFTKKPANLPFTVNLRKGDVYQVIASSASKGSPADFTGSLIQANKPIAVFSGHNGAYIPIPEKGYNHLVEQLPPLSAWGRHYYVGTLLGRTRSTIRVVAAEDDTKVFANGKQVATLLAGEYYENGAVNGMTQITGDKRILLAQYAHGFENGLDSIGDPMMILLTPTQQFLKKYRFATPTRGQWHHYVNLVVPKESVESMRLDGRPMNPQVFKPFGESRYAIAQIEVSYGTHTLEGTENFGLYSYGFGYGDDSYDAYGNMVGQSFLELREVKDTLAPMANLSAASVLASQQNSLSNSSPISSPSSAQNPRVSLRNSIAPQISKVIVSDDREDDKGLALVRIVDAGGLNIVAPSVVAGAPQAEIILNEQAQTQSGRAIIEASDVAGNTQRFTLCFTKDQVGSDNLISVSPGVQEYCPQKTLWYGGVFGTLAVTAHTLAPSGFNGFDNFRTVGNFAGTADGVLRLVGGGIVVGYRFSPTWGISARLGTESFPGILRAPDPASASPRLDTLTLDPSGRPTLTQQGYTLALTSVYASLSLLAECYLSNNFYALAGLKTSLAITRSLALNRIIITPSNAVYANTRTAEREIFNGASESVATLLPSVVGGIGVTVPIWRNIAAFGELTYAHPLGTVLVGQEWRISQLSLSIGGRMRF
ncbi:MAG: hypothetical protein EAZ92_07275 [Candidatus Kapaibacterium sp.]|nr:MAG: hypothetical protein EAZ92_07275 [Candidatus Kapabacteria bacterium]